MRIISAIFLSLILTIFAANAVFAAGADCPITGLVPCGTATCPCELCDFFVMVQKIVNFILFTIVPAVAVLLVVIGGIFFILGSGYDPSLISKGKATLTSVVIGLLITYGSWVIVNLFFVTIGLANTDLSKRIGQWFVFPCGPEKTSVIETNETGAIITKPPVTELEAYAQLYALLAKGEINQTSFKIKPIPKRRVVYIYIQEPAKENALLAEQWLEENGYGDIPEGKVIYFKAAQ